MTEQQESKAWREAAKLAGIRPVNDEDTKSADEATMIWWECDTCGYTCERRTNEYNECPECGDNMLRRFCVTPSTPKENNQR